MGISNSSSELAFQQLRDLRPVLLNFHKALMEAEKANYEASFGPITSKGEYLQLVLGHEQFSWLRPISQFIVQVDEVLMAREPQPVEKAVALLAAARHLLHDSETGQTLQQRWQQLTPHQPGLPAMQAKLLELLDPHQ